MTERITNKPAGLYCEALWELYVLLEDLERPYLKITEKETFLWFISNVELTIGDKQYDFDSIANIDIPYHIETVTICLRRLECDKEITYDLEISMNTLYRWETTAGLLLERYHASLPSEEEIDSILMKNGIPLTYIEKDPVHVKKRKSYKPVSARYSDRILYLMDFFDYEKISYRFDKEGDIPRFTMIYDIPEIANGQLTGSIKFLKDHAEFKLCIAVENMEADRIPELLKLINHINSEAVVMQNWSISRNEDQIFYTPRFFLSEEDDGTAITASTFINYRVWEIVWTTNDYITKDCPSLLASLAHPVLGFANGELTLEEAMKEVDALTQQTVPF